MQSWKLPLSVLSVRSRYSCRTAATPLPAQRSLFLREQNLISSAAPAPAPAPPPAPLGHRRRASRPLRRLRCFATIRTAQRRCCRCVPCWMLRLVSCEAVCACCLLLACAGVTSMACNMVDKSSTDLALLPLCRVRLVVEREARAQELCANNAACSPSRTHQHWHHVPVIHAQLASAFSAQPPKLRFHRAVMGTILQWLGGK